MFRIQPVAPATGSTFQNGNFRLHHGGSSWNLSTASHSTVGSSSQFRWTGGVDVEGIILAARVRLSFSLGSSNPGSGEETMFNQVMQVGSDTFTWVSPAETLSGYSYRNWLGSLPDRNFRVPGFRTTFTIGNLVTVHRAGSTPALVLEFYPAPLLFNGRGWKLYIGRHVFAFSDAFYDVSEGDFPAPVLNGFGNPIHRYVWRETATRPLPDLRLGGSARVRLTRARSGNQESAPEQGPLSAELVDAPATHDGAGDIVFELRFNRALADGFSGATLQGSDTQEGALSVTGGTLAGVERIVAGDTRRWRVTVSPASASEDVHIALAPTFDCAAANAICSASGEPLSVGLARVVVAAPATSAATQGAESDPPGPTPADTTNRVRCTRDVLNARLTVGEGGGVRGFDAAADAGALSPTGFGVRGKRYAIDALGVVPGGGGALRVSLASALESDHGLILYAGAERFEFAGSTYRSGSHTVEWAGAGLDWTPGSTVDVRIAQRIERLTSRDLGKPVLQRSDRLPYADGDTLWLTHGNLPLNRECLPPADAFRVTGDGTGIAVEAVSISYATVTLTLERALAAGAAVRVSYTAPEDNALQNGYGTETDGFTDVAVRNRTAAPVAQTPAPAGPLTAELVALPATHDGASDITFELRFNQTLKGTFSYSAWANILSITGGSFARAERIVKSGDARNRRWRITVSPSSATEDLSITLSPTRDCSGASALCTDSGVPLSVGLARLVLHTPATTEATQEPPRQTEPEKPPLTVAYSTPPPAEHDGERAFTFAFGFSENLHADYSYATMRDHSLSVVQGGALLTPSCEAAGPRAEGNNQDVGGDGDPDGLRGHRHRPRAERGLRRCGCAVHERRARARNRAAGHDRRRPAGAGGGGRERAGGGRGEPRLRRHPEPGGDGAGDGGLRDRGRDGDGRGGLHRDIGDADLRAGRDRANGVGAGAGRRP